MKTVIFACIHSAGRSQMAAAFFNAMTNASVARAVSAGTHPAERVHPEVLATMNEVGIDLSNAKPQLLTKDLAVGASLLITMGCGDECPFVPGLRRDDWPLQDPKGQAIERVREIRDDIVSRVSKLLANEGWQWPAPLNEPPLTKPNREISSF
jgi:arsenate reductase (thioredoxin)